MPLLSAYDSIRLDLFGKRQSPVFLPKAQPHPMKMKKGVKFTSLPIPKDVQDRLVSVVIQEEGRKRSFGMVAK
jgi:hypothetical protein